MKYHPTESTSSYTERSEAVKKRLEVFNELLASSLVEVPTSLDYENAEKIIRFMDSVVVRLEGGSDDDLEALKQEPVEDDSVTDLKKAASVSR